MEALTHINCENCGAQVEVVPGQLVLTCPYCGSAINLVKKEESAPIVYDFLVPTDGDRSRLRSVARKLMIAPNDAPDDVLDLSTFDEENFRFIPFWLAEGSFVSHWSASFGFDRTETYTEYVTQIDTQGRRYQTPETRYRKVTDWRPTSGTATGNFRLLKYGGNIDKLPPYVISLLENPKALGEIATFTPALMGGFEADDFTLEAEDARKDFKLL
ncbi:MAG: hypothetical protein LBE31_01130, partial [Deltaproteobacteria bacterium]|nr:hypothetical protein [Deltaproteobacteria bacterium]